MSIQSIFNFIDNKNYIINNELSFNNYFKGDINDYIKYDKNLINVFKEKYENKLFCTENSIIIENDKNKILIFYKIVNNELYWTIKII
jgi:hypothetical protein